MHPVGFGIRSTISVLNQSSKELAKNTDSQALAALLTQDLREWGLGVCIFNQLGVVARFRNHCAKGHLPNPLFQEGMAGGFSSLAYDILASTFPAPEDLTTIKVPDFPPWLLLSAHLHHQSEVAARKRRAR